MRFITKQKDGEYIIDSERANAAIKKLGKLEDMYDALVKSNAETAEKMAVLREKGDNKSVTFKELLVKKLNNNNMLDMLKMYTAE